MTGQTFLHYRILEKIGEGGMGVVFKAQDTHLDRLVAVKFLPAESLSDPDRRQRFVLEAKAASSLNHPNIIVIHDIASDAGHDFIVMEYVDGKPLDQLIGRKGMRFNEALRLAVQIADGLARAHAAGIVHRDLKPSNVMVTPDGRVKLLDFGLAKLAEAGPPADAAGPTVTLGRPDRPRTEEGFIMGTVAYMSPEQAEGKAVDSRSDIFAFGALLYEMLTGSRAFRGETRMSTLAAILRDEPKPAFGLNSTLPPDIEPILARCLRKDPQRRYQTMSDLKVVLQDLKEDSESGKLRAPVTAVRARRKGTLFWAVPAALVLAAAALLLVFLPRKASPPEYEITRLTFDSGTTLAPAFSPDGKMFAYASDRGGDGNPDIWLQQVAGGLPLRLTTDPARDGPPSFSSDGSRIIFSSSRDGTGIYEVGTLGGGEIRLAGPGTHPRCSPDGAWISYIEVPASPDSLLIKMFLLPARGGTPVPFQPDFNIVGLASGSAPVWSPDGKYIIFNGQRSSGPASLDWWVAPVQGGPAVSTGAHAHLVLNSVFQVPYAWAGSFVYYSTGTTVEGVNLFRVPIEKDTWKVRGPAERITSGAGMQYLASVAADGRVLYSDLTWVANICTLAAQPDQGVVSGSLVPVTKDLTAKFDPSLSRDGTKLAYTSFTGFRNEGGQIRLMDLDSGREEAYPMRTPQLGRMPRISPDGTVLAYRERAAGKSRTFLIRGLASSPREVCDSCVILGFYADPNFALAWEKGEQYLRLNIATGEKTPVLEAAAGEISALALSPDDRWVAFVLDKPDGHVAMYLAPLSGGPPPPESDWILLFDEQSYLGSPSWSPGGNYLYYLSERDGACSVWSQKLDPKSKRPDGPGRVVFRPQGRINLNMPRGNGKVSVGKDKLAVWTGESAGNIYLATPKKK